MLQLVAHWDPRSWCNSCMIIGHRIMSMPMESPNKELHQGKTAYKHNQSVGLSIAKSRLPEK